jgi:hypothetical protein
MGFELLRKAHALPTFANGMERLGSSAVFPSKCGRANPMSRREVQKRAFDSAEAQLPAGDEAQWAKFDYLKLRETLEAIVSSMEATAQDIDSPQTEGEPDSTLRLVVSNDVPLPVSNDPPMVVSKDPPMVVSNDQTENGKEPPSAA